MESHSNHQEYWVGNYRESDAIQKDMEGWQTYSESLNGGQGFNELLEPDVTGQIWSHDLVLQYV